MSPEAFIYGAVIGVALAFLIARLSGRPLKLRRPSLLDLLMLAIFLAVPYAIQAIGLGFETGLLLLFVAAVIVYAWRRLRPQPS